MKRSKLHQGQIRKISFICIMNGYLHATIPRCALPARKVAPAHQGCAPPFPRPAPPAGSPASRILSCTCVSAPSTAEVPAWNRPSRSSSVATGTAQTASKSALTPAAVDRRGQTRPGVYFRILSVSTRTPFSILLHFLALGSGVSPPFSSFPASPHAPKHARPTPCSTLYTFSTHTLLTLALRVYILHT